MINIKKFIAGTICPNCKKMDSIRFWKAEGTYFKDCISCDYQEKLATSSKKHPTGESIDIKIL